MAAVRAAPEWWFSSFSVVGGTIPGGSLAQPIRESVRVGIPLTWGRSLRSPLPGISAERGGAPQGEQITPM